MHLSVPSGIQWSECSKVCVWPPYWQSELGCWTSLKMKWQLPFYLRSCCHLVAEETKSVICPWLVCFWGSHHMCSAQRAYGEVDWFLTKPSTVQRERQRSCLYILLNCSFQWLCFDSCQNPPVLRQSCYLHQWNKLIFQRERKTDLPWLQKLQIPVWG